MSQLIVLGSLICLKDLIERSVVFIRLTTQPDKLQRISALALRYRNTIDSMSDHLLYHFVFHHFLYTWRSTGRLLCSGVQCHLTINSVMKVELSKEKMRCCFNCSQNYVGGRVPLVKVLGVTKGTVHQSGHTSRRSTFRLCWNLFQTVYSAATSTVVGSLHL